MDTPHIMAPMCHGLCLTQERRFGDGKILPELNIEGVWQRQYANRDEARPDNNQIIAAFYNPSRLHPTLS